MAALKGRPSAGVKNPEHTNTDWCEYDEPTGSYRYTRAYVKAPHQEVRHRRRFREVTGMEPRAKPAGRA
jgi:hypothetical protein